MKKIFVAAALVKESNQPTAAVYLDEGLRPIQNRLAGASVKGWEQGAVRLQTDRDGEGAWASEEEIVLGRSRNWSNECVSGREGELESSRTKNRVGV
jgi:hypothetical protein